ncbi:MAG: sigma-70 family RNA polymerase sigma factor [Archangium sp.]|nr:sigma-70 family RNA polymerase sigma factor [Archangium sp.]
MSALDVTQGDGTAALIAAAARREREALRKLTERLLPVVRARVRRLQSKRADLRGLDTADLVQQVFVVLLDDDAWQLRQWDPARGATLEGYVGMVSEREVGNSSQRAMTRERREATDEPQADAPIEQPSPEAQVIARQAAARLGEFLDGQLPPKGQVVLKCLYADGLDADEAARVLGVTKQVIYNWQHKIRLLAREFSAAH